MSTAGRFNTLPIEKCRELLGTNTIGRVGWNTVDGPEILPVTYALHNGTIIFRTAAYGSLAELRQVRQVAFQIDDFDPVTRTGWSVLVHGQTRAASRADELLELWGREDPEPWADGTRNLFIAISLNHVTGRSITAA
jgi:uncharacterized protein